MGKSNIRMIHLLLSLAMTNGQQSISFKSTRKERLIKPEDCYVTVTLGPCDIALSKMIHLSLIV